jgi:hypothetical protein
MEVPRWEAGRHFTNGHPDSGGLIKLSAVGFNAEKTIAVVFIGYHFGEECRGGEFRALEEDRQVAITNGKRTVEPLRLVCTRPPCLRILLALRGSHTILEISNVQSQRDIRESHSQ